MTLNSCLVFAVAFIVIHVAHDGYRVIGETLTDMSKLFPILLKAYITFSFKAAPTMLLAVPTELGSATTTHTTHETTEALYSRQRDRKSVV